MKVIKLFFAALAMTFAMNASAEKFFNGKFIADVKGGITSPGSLGAWGVGVGYEKNLNSWLAWDVLNVDFTDTFKNAGDGIQIGVKTGLRGFTKSFWGDNWRGYANLGGGYTFLKAGSRSAFGMVIGAGLQLKEKVSLGYSFQFETAGESKGHFFTVGYAF